MPLDLSLPAKTAATAHPQSFPTLKVRSDLLMSRCSPASERHVNSASTTGQAIVSSAATSSDRNMNSSSSALLDALKSRKQEPRQTQFIKEEQVRELSNKFSIERSSSKAWATSSTPRHALSTPRPAVSTPRTPPAAAAARSTKAWVNNKPAAKEAKYPTSPATASPATGIWNLREEDMLRMLKPYVEYRDKKHTCTVCNMKFLSKQKAFSHLENKHIDCFQYKCPLCRTTKTSRLAFDGHVRSRHAAKKKELEPLLRLKRPFGIKSEKQAGLLLHAEKTTGNYDLLFVTFLRDELNRTDEKKESVTTTSAWPRSSTLPASPSFSSSSREGSLSPQSSPRSPGREPVSDQPLQASWVNKDQGIFHIRDKELFAQKWFEKKGVEERGSSCWERLELEVLSTFQERNIIKVISTSPTVLQIFCIRQLVQ